MKNRTIALWSLALTAMTTLTFGTCDGGGGSVQDPCNGNGDLSHGICQCYTGWEGPACDSKWATKFVGKWKVEANCASASGATYQKSYIVEMSEVDENTVLLTNFGNHGLATTVEFELTSTDHLDIYGIDSGGRLLVGTNTFLNNGYSTFNYNESKDGTAIENCQGTLTKL